jgi:hypothetical protein
MSYAVYVVNYNDEERRNHMIRRAKSVGIDLHFADPVSVEDPRIKNQSITLFEKRSWAILFQHLDCMRNFFENTTYDYCIVCEDDVVFLRELNQRVQEVIKGVEETKHDIVLLSYLWPYDIVENGYFPLKHQADTFKIYGYPDDLWGAHMYMVSRKHAKTLVDRFTAEYAINEHNEGRHFCSDWQITKYGERGIIYPMLGLEEGEVKTDHQGQINFHRAVFNHHYHENLFLC